MSFKLGPLNLNAVAQGVGGLVFGGGSSGEKHENDGGVEELLERINNGVLLDDRRSAISELRDVVAEDVRAQAALGAMGMPVLSSVLREEREDLEMVRCGLEVLINGINGNNCGGGGTTPAEVEAQRASAAAGSATAEAFARDKSNVALLLSLLEEEDFYVRYHTVRLLTLLLTNCAYRLQEAILESPMGVARLMDMMLEREVIRNEALLLLISLTRQNEEIQKIVVFEGAFERLFNIIREEGGADGGIIVQDCLELLNNLIRGNVSNQVFFRECGFLPKIPPILRVRTSGREMHRQKLANLLCAFETLTLLLVRRGAGPEAQNRLANQTLLAQNKVLDAILPLAMESRVAAVALRTQALHCVGELVQGHAANQVLLGSATVDPRNDEEQAPALQCILSIALRAADAGERNAAQHVLKCYCEGNSDGQVMLASTITPMPQDRGVAEEPLGLDASFGSMLVQALVASDGRGDMQASCRAATALSHILSGNTACKERVLNIPLEIPSSSAAPPELLLPRCVRYLATAGKSPSTARTLQPVLLRLLITWLRDCPTAVGSFLSSPSHLILLTDMVVKSDSSHVAGLASVLLGVCLCNTPLGGPCSSETVLDVITSKVGLSHMFEKWEEMRRTPEFLAAAAAPKLPKPFTREVAKAATASLADDGPTGPLESAEEGHAGPAVAAAAAAVVTGGVADTTSFYDNEFARFVQDFEGAVKQQVLNVYARPQGCQAAEAPEDALRRLDAGTQGMDFVDVSRHYRAALLKLLGEMADVRQRNAVLAESLLTSAAARDAGGPAGDAHGGGADSSSGGSAAVDKSMEALKAARASKASEEVEAAKREVEQWRNTAKASEAQAAALKSELEEARALAAKHEQDLQALSGAYNSLEQENFRLEEALREAESKRPPASTAAPGVEALIAARAEGREQGKQEAAEEHESEMNDLLVCLGQEESKVERLSRALTELGQDVEALLAEVAAEEEGKDDEEDEEGEEDS